LGQADDIRVRVPKYPTWKSARPPGMLRRIWTPHQSEIPPLTQRGASIPAALSVLFLYKVRDFPL
jgi:hypothetical protein